MSNSNLKTIRDGYGVGLAEAAKNNESIVALTADLKDSTRLGEFEEKFYDRFFQCGIGEQNMMGVAAGLALGGKIPFVNSFAVFSPGRNWDQLRVSVCYSNLNVKIAGHHSGFSAAQDGATHQALEDIAITRVLPNLVVLHPADAQEAVEIVQAAAKYIGPVYIRLSKYDFDKPNYEREKFKIGKAEVVLKGKDLTLAVSGAMVNNCVAAAEKIADKISVEVLKYSSIKPFDKETLVNSVSKTGSVLTVEDHQIDGGFGSLICEVLAESHPAQVVRHGMYNQFGTSGSIDNLLRYYSLDVEGIKNKILTFKKESL